MIFLDSNIPMYLVGASHPHKTDAQRLLERAIADDQRLVTDAEALQEILHRYTAIRQPDAIQPAFDAILGLADEVFPIELADANRAKDLLFGQPASSARDAIHVAVMERHGIRRIMSFDAGFQRFPGLERLGA